MAELGERTEFPFEARHTLRRGAIEHLQRHFAVVQAIKGRVHGTERSRSKALAELESFFGGWGERSGHERTILQSATMVAMRNLIVIALIAAVLVAALVPSAAIAVVVFVGVRILFAVVALRRESPRTFGQLVALARHTPFRAPPV